MAHPCYSVISPEQLEEFCKQNEFVLEPGYPYLDLSEERKELIRNNAHATSQLPNMATWLRKHFSDQIRCDGIEWESDYQSAYLVSKNKEILIHSAEEHKDLKFYIDGSEEVKFVFKGDKITLVNKHEKESKKWWTTLLCLFKKQKN